MTTLVGVSSGGTGSGTGYNSNRLHLAKNSGGFAIAKASGTVETFNFVATEIALNPSAIVYITDTDGFVQWASAQFTVALGLNSIPVTEALQVVEGQVDYYLGIISSGGFQVEHDGSGTFYNDRVNHTFGNPFPEPIVTTASDAWTGKPLVWLEGTSSPTVEITGDLQPGASFTLTYANMDQIPVSPVTLTDTPPEGGTANSITVPVTINDTVTNGKHGGTATGTMPALPTTGSITGLRFGTVNVALSTA